MFLVMQSSTLLGFYVTVGEEQEKATKGDKIGLADLVFGFIPAGSSP